MLNSPTTASSPSHRVDVAATRSGVTMARVDLPTAPWPTIENPTVAWWIETPE
jgi:hypothetical protein